jgi:hypothetical protein
MISASNASSKRTDCPKVGMLPKPNLAGDSHRRMHQCGADHQVARLVDNHSRAAFVTIRVKPSLGDFGNVIIDARPNHASAPHLRSCHGNDLRVREDDLRHGVMVRARGDTAPFSSVL